MMKPFEKQLWIIFITSVALGLCWQFFPLSDAQERLDRLPTVGLGFSGYDIDLNPIEKNAFNHVNVIKREYDIHGKDYFITVVDGTKNRHVVHDPNYCFVGDGWMVNSESEFPIQNGLAKQILLEKGNKTREVVYWFSDGYSKWTSPFYYWWKTTLRRITFGYSGPEPVLIIVQPLNGVNFNPDGFQKAFEELFQL